MRIIELSLSPPAYSAVKTRSYVRPSTPRPSSSVAFERLLSGVRMRPQQTFKLRSRVSTCQTGQERGPSSTETGSTT